MERGPAGGLDGGRDEERDTSRTSLGQLAIGTTALAAARTGGGVPSAAAHAGLGTWPAGALARRVDLTARLTPRLRLLTPKGEEIAVSALGSDPVRAALYCGPWLVVADEEADPVFFGEPWPGNVVTLPRNLTPRADAGGRLRLRVTCEHEGFRGSLPTELRPMGETSADEQKTIAFWLDHRRA